jgi:phospholipid/cholesterol/gamma-HCH transport system substrate-binding protein
MENRSHALLAGIFAILLLIGGVAAGIWISKKNIPLKPYELVSSSPVTGLSVQSQVRYQGVPVGRVDSMRFIANKPGQIRIRIGVDPKTPITLGTWAELVTSGVTGISNIELRDTGALPTLLDSSVEDIQAIPMRPSFWERLQSQGSGMINSAEKLMVQLEKFTNAENAAAFQQTMQNTAQLTAKLNQSLTALEPSLKKFPSLVESMTQASDRISGLAGTTQKTIDSLNAPNGPLHQAVMSLQGIRLAVAQLRTSTLPDLAALSVNATDAARAFSLTARQLGQAPQSLIFGPPQATPGPGEPGFVGFGSTAR